MDSPGTTIPAFIAKLWEMVNESKYDSLMKWCKGGSSFVIKAPNTFASELLPIYYKHNNMSSFIRQLNKYGFKKVVAIESTSLKNERTDLEFSHPHFLKDYPQLLPAIKRKMSSSNKDMTYPNVMVQIAKEVQLLQQKQHIFESKLRTMKNENSALWREHSLLRHKHQNLQKLLNKLIQFLFTLVQQTRGMNVKRINLPLMIKDKTNGYSIDNCLAAIKDHSHRQSSGISDLPRNHSNADNIIITNGGSNHEELIVPDILHESSAATPSDIDRTPKNFRSRYIEEEDEEELLSPVPLQEVSPAILPGAKASQQSLPQKATHTKSLKRPQSKASNSFLIKKSKSAFPVNTKEDTVQPKAQLSSSKKFTGMKNSITTENNTNFLTSGAQSILKDKKVAKRVDVTENSLSSPNETLPLVHSPSGSQLSPGIESSNQKKKKKDDEGLEPLQKDIDNHIGAIQSDLDVLKDLLQGEGISLDASTLLGLMHEDPLSLWMPEALGLPPNEPPPSGGSCDDNQQQLISFAHQPTLLDIVDDCLVDSPTETDQLTEELISSCLNTPRPFSEANSTHS